MSKKQETLHFSVDPQLAALLGENYRSTEDAIKELVDNAHDADSENVWISLPADFAESPEVVVRDNGSGMKTNEVETEYLKIARSRLSRKGNLSTIKKRVVKGRKGIGKFAGLLVAEVMIVETCAAGKRTVLTISKKKLSEAGYDLEKVELPVQTYDCAMGEHGTTIILRGLNDNLHYPNPDKLKQLLARDYHRLQGFEIKVNEEKVTLADFSPNTITKDFTLKDGSVITATVAQALRPNSKNAGVSYRVENKLVGRPENLLADNEIIPVKLRNSYLCEVNDDGLSNDVTADGGAILENSKRAEEIREIMTAFLTETISERHKNAMHLANLNHKKKIEKALQQLPEYKRKYAERHLYKVLEKFYEESDERIAAVISVMVDALEFDHYWNVVKAIEDARASDVMKLSEAFEDFGLMEMSMITSQAINRLRFLDELEVLCSNEKTEEKTIHKALEKCLWVFGQSYSIMISNRTLKVFAKGYLDKHFTGERADKRPDLLLANDVIGRHLLVEFKRPAISIGRDEENQAVKYADDFKRLLNDVAIDIIIVGGKVDPQMSPNNNRPNVKFYSFTHLISDARTQLQWMIEELKKEVELPEMSSAPLLA